MQDLTAEFEELFDPYLPVASRLKIKPGLGVSLIEFAALELLLPIHFYFQTIEFCDMDPSSFNLEIPSSYHGKWKVRKTAIIPWRII